MAEGQDRGLPVKGFIMSHQLFSTGFRGSSGPCRCTSVCCEGGVWTDVRERDKILLHQDVVKKYLDETQSKDPSTWFEQREVDDPDFPSGRSVATEEINNKCAFLDGKGRCSLQVAAVGEGWHKWALKPLFCILFPIEITEKVVSFDDMLQDEQSCCSVTAPFDTPLFEGCKEELVHLVGEDGYRAMEDHYTTQRRVSNEVTGR
jgi:hypothetical protein